MKYLKKKIVLFYYLNGLMAFARQFCQCVHLPCRRVVADGTGVAARIGAMADVRRRFAVVQNGS